MKIFKIAAFVLLCACFVLAQTPATQPVTANPQASSTQVTKAYAGICQRQLSQDRLDLKSQPGPGSAIQHHSQQLGPLAADAIEHSGGDNHRATISNLQPNTTYYVRMVDKQGQPVGPVFTFKTPAQGQPPIHEQPLQSQ